MSSFSFLLTPEGPLLVMKNIAANGSSETKIITSKNWTNEVSKMNISGAVKQLASNCFFDRIDNNILYLKIQENQKILLKKLV